MSEGWRETGMIFPKLCFLSSKVEFSLYKNLNISFSLICIPRELLLWLLAFMNLGSFLWNPAFCIYQLITNISKNEKLLKKIAVEYTMVEVSHNLFKYSSYGYSSCFQTRWPTRNGYNWQNKLCYKGKRTVKILSENSLLPKRYLIVPSIVLTWIFFLRCNYIC